MAFFFIFLFSRYPDQSPGNSFFMCCAFRLIYRCYKSIGPIRHPKHLSYTFQSVNISKTHNKLDFIVPSSSPLVERMV